jgi:hypothetical protein
MNSLAARWFLACWLGVAFSLVAGNSPALATGSRSGADQAASSLKMAFRDGNLTAEIVAAPLHEVMTEISKLTGAEVRWLGQHADERVSSTFTGMPLHEALERILRRNFTLSYAASGLLTDVWILSRAKAEEPTAGLQAATATDRFIEVDEGRTNPPTGRNQPRARMAPDVGIKEAPAASSAGIDIAEQPLPARREVVALLAMHADNDEAAREILSHVASDDADAQVREIASMVLLGLK